MANGAQIENLSEFQRALDQALQTVNEEDMRKVIKKIIFDALRGFVLKTRVDTGRARGGWQISKNSPVSSETGKLDKTGTSVLNEGLSRLSDVSADDTIFIQNNVVYIGILENLDGMVENTLRQLTARLRSGSL